ncbi:MAG: O-antigen ligase family protein [Cyclobacteriaceae bacterium]
MKRVELNDKKIFLIILYTFFFTTLWFNNHSQLWSTIRSYFYFYTAATFSILYTIIFCRGFFIRISLIDVAFYTYILFVSVNTLSKSLSFWENDLFLSNTIFGILYFVFKNNLSNRELFWDIGKGLVLFAVMASLYGLLDEIIFLCKFKSLTAISGPFSNSGPFAGYLLSVIPITIGLLHKTKLTGSKRTRYLYVFALIIELLALLFSQSRAGLFGLIIAVLFWMIYLQKPTVYQVWCHFKHNIGKLIIMSSIGVSIMFMVLYYNIDSVLGRLLIWEVSWKILEDSWLFGIGFGRFSIKYLDYQSKHFADSNFATGEQLADNTYYAFNDLLQISVESGVVGISLFLAMVFLVFFNRNFSKKNAQVAIQTAIKSSLLAILGFGLFSYPFSSLPTQLNFIFFLALTSSFRPTILKIHFHQKVRSLLTLIFIVLIGLFGTDQFKKYSFIKKWSNISDYLSLSEREILSSFEHIYPILKSRGDFLFNYGARLSEMGHPKKAISVLNEARKKFNHMDLHIFMGKSYSALNNTIKAEESYLHASNMVPNRMYPKYLLLVHYKNNAQWCQAFFQANKILDMQVKVPSFFADEILLKTREFIRHYDDKKCTENLR